MTIKEAIRLSSKEIPPKVARILLAHHLKCDKLELIMQEDRVLPDEKSYFDLVKRAKESEPIEYITNQVSFYMEEFIIKKGSLIPRPETEILIDKSLEVLKELKRPKVAEIGVGSGIISIILALKVKDIKIVATDISIDSINLAKENAKKFNVTNKIEFIHTPFLDGINDNFDIIISNPPYIANSCELDKNLSYEPDIALFGGNSGDEILKEIIKLWLDSSATYLCCEMGYDQKNSLKSFLNQHGITNVEFYKDLAGFDRGFVASKGESY